MILKINNIANSIVSRPIFNKIGLNKLSYPNLAPLPKDTVSFSGRSELVASSMADAPSVLLCKNVQQNAEPACYYLEKVFEKYFDPITKKKDSDKPSKYPIVAHSTRIKSHTSIREKVVSKHAKLYQQEQDDYAVMLVDELLKHYKLSDGVQPEYVYRAIKQDLMYNSGARKTSPFVNTAFSVQQSLEVIASLKYIDFNQVPPSQNKIIMDELIDELTPKGDTKIVVNSKYADPTTISGIKHYARDIVGGRIVMNDSGPEYTGLILDALARAVEDGALKITSIESHIPDVNKLPADKKLSDYEYATEAQLRSLAKTSGAELIMNKSKTGYMAIHINIDLSNENFKTYNGVFNGYSGEIQLLGRDVEQLKDIEDLCYKIKDKKNAFKSVYLPFKDHFLQYYTDDVKDAFEDYTYALYLDQRSIHTKKGAKKFRTIAELGFDGQVPEQLDFNRLKVKKSDCDCNYEIMKNEERKKASRHRDIVKEGNITTMKRVVDAMFED